MDLVPPEYLLEESNIREIVLDSFKWIFLKCCSIIFLLIKVDHTIRKIYLVLCEIEICEVENDNLICE